MPYCKGQCWRKANQTICGGCGKPCTEDFLDIKLLHKKYHKARYRFSSLFASYVFFLPSPLSSPLILPFSSFCLLSFLTFLSLFSLASPPPLSMNYRLALSAYHATNPSPEGSVREPMAPRASIAPLACSNTVSFCPRFPKYK